MGSKGRIAIPEMVFCWGGAHQDIKFKCLTKPVLKSSNPAYASRHWGGVARNIGENLVRLGVATSLCSRVGSDSVGGELLKSLSEMGIGSRWVSRSETNPTASYTAILSPQGDLTLAVADMAIYEELNRSWAIDCLDFARKAKHWILDTNLPEKTIHFLAAEKPDSVDLWCVPTSEAKAERLRGCLARVRGLVLNRAELAVLSGHSDLKRGCRQLIGLGVQMLWVTQGLEGVTFAEGVTIQTTPLKKLHTLKDVTGAGDAFAAGVLYAFIEGKTGPVATRFGLAAAQLTVSSTESVAEGMTSSRLKKEVQLQ